MKFVKMHGLGNDFVFFGGEDARRVEASDPAALAQKLCQKHFGVCADGLVLILPSASCDAVSYTHLSTAPARRTRTTST